MPPRAVVALVWRSENLARSLQSGASLPEGGVRAAEAPDRSGSGLRWREGNGGGWSPRSGQVSDPDAEGENRDQERQRNGEKDEVDRRYAAVDDGRLGRFRGTYDFALAADEERGA